MGACVSRDHCPKCKVNTPMVFHHLSPVINTRLLREEVALESYSSLISRREKTKKYRLAAIVKNNLRELVAEKLELD
jgi:hypothetical protein